MGIQKFTWHFIQCDRCGFTPHQWGSPREGGYLAAFETRKQAEDWMRGHDWRRVGRDWYCPRCIRETHLDNA